MLKTNNFIFWALYIVAWLIFVGLCIEAGGLIVNFFFSLYKPDFVQNLYQKLDLTEMYKDSKLSFFGIYSFILTISILKACLFYIVIKLMHKMNLLKPGYKDYPETSWIRMKDTPEKEGVLNNLRSEKTVLSIFALVLLIVFLILIRL